MWFKVDDRLPDHRKARAVRKSHPDKRRDASPFGLWVLAGAWCGANPTTGFVPLEILESWDDDAAVLAERLVSAGMWWPTVQDGEPGYGFHDWQDYVPRPDGVNDPSESGQRGNHVRWHEARGVTGDNCEFCHPVSGANRPDDRGDIGATDPDVSGANRDPVPSRPDPTNPEAKTATASATAEREFDEFWTAYPKKQDKGPGAKAYRAARKRVGHAVILETLERDKRDKWAHTERQFIPLPATWLRKDPWDDEPELPQDDADTGNRWQMPEPPPDIADDPARYQSWLAEQRRMAGL